jgi:hypothetical protein
MHIPASRAATLIDLWHLIAISNPPSMTGPCHHLSHNLLHALL